MSRESGKTSENLAAQFLEKLGFRIIARNVEVGDLVKPGQVMAQLDPLVLDLAVRSSEADLARARSQLSNAAAAERRAGTLLGRQVASQADFDNALQAREASTASVQHSTSSRSASRPTRARVIAPHPRCPRSPRSPPATASPPSRRPRRRASRPWPTPSRPPAPLTLPTRTPRRSGPRSFNEARH